MAWGGHVWTQVMGTTLILLTSYGVGALGLRRFPFRSRWEAFLWTVALGLGLSGTLGFLLAWFGVLYRGVWWAYTGLGGAIGCVLGVRLLRWGPRWAIGPTASWGLRLGYGLLGLLLGMLYVLTLYPPIHWDATSYHLVFARVALERHELPRMPDLGIPVFPALSHMLFTWAMALKGDTLAQAIEWVALGLVAGGLGTWGRRPVLDLTLAVLWVVTPIVMRLGTSGYVDVGATAFTFLGLAALARFEERNEAGWLSLGSVLLAMGAGAKMNVLPWWGLGMLWALWAGRRRGVPWHRLVRVVVLGVAFAVPWYGWIAAMTGNPLWLAWPGGRAIWREAAQTARAYWLQIVGIPGDLLSLLRVPWTVMAEPARLYAEAPFSPLAPLLWPATVVAVWDRSTRRWTLAAWYFVGTWFLAHRQLRHLVPLIPVLHRAVGEALAWGMDRWRPLARGLTWVSGGVFILAVGYGMKTMGRDLTVLGFPPATPAAREAFLRRTVAGYAGVEYVNRHAGPADRVYLLSGSYLRYHLKPTVFDAGSILGSHVLRTYTEPDCLGALSDRWTWWLLAQGFEWVLIGPTPGRWDIPPDNPFWRHYRLVYLRTGVWVFQRAARPVRVAFVPLGAADGTCHSVSSDRPLLESRPVRPGVLLVRFQARGTDFRRFRWEWEGEGWGRGSQSFQVRSQPQSYFYLLSGPETPAVGHFRWRFETYPPLTPHALEVCDIRVYQVLGEESPRGP